ncbi:hypothetical protein Mpop_2715 [Methylorubrum populi BJ001]|jgi:ribosome modulation factor|uniref:Uncharacterized protein n=1 Tax=Methylorubrum populi (strain ATCC BAA-705 / NCIMB 13946 / BJ001) TaxID=441620 RepID=B1ZD01_METPB|nr:hypothetical protein [Methylorubrum populi]ACB80870.1 hypothetical protein Mpop_2715 [Methylorubrum populi BJ001]
MTDRATNPTTDAQHIEGDAGDIPEFLRRPRSAATSSEAVPDPSALPADQPEPGDDDFQEDEEAPHQRVARERAAETRAAEEALEREASGGATAEDVLGFNGQPVIVGDPAIVRFGTKRNQTEKSGTLLKIEDAKNVRVRLVGSKDPLGEVFPVQRVSTEPVNGGKPLTSKAAQRKAADHAHHMTEFREASGGRAARPSDGFAHAQAAADEEEAPLPKKMLRKGDNGGVSEMTILRHVGVIRAAKEAVASATGKLREKMKKAKDDGVDPKVLNKILDELRMSPDELTDSINRENDYRRAVHLPAAGHIHIFGEEDRDTHEKRLAHAREEGYRAGYRGADKSSNPYPDENDQCHQAWNDKWSEAQGHLLGKGLKELRQ